MAKPVEQLHLLGGVAVHRVVLRQPEDELLDPRPQLVREVRRRRADEGVDIVQQSPALSSVRALSIEPVASGDTALLAFVAVTGITAAITVAL